MAKEAIFALFVIFLRNFKQIKENFPKAMRNQVKYIKNENITIFLATF